MTQGNTSESRSKHIASVFFVFAFVAAGFSAVERTTASADNLPSSKSVKSQTNSDEAASPSNSTSVDADATALSKPAARPMEEIVNNSFDLGFEEYNATAYCLNGSTASGAHTREGVIAADPRVIPLGSIVHIKAGRYSGTYLAVDTGGRIRGHLIDIFMRDLKEARLFGRRKIKLKVIGKTAPVYLREKTSE